MIMNCKKVKKFLINNEFESITEVDKNMRLHIEKCSSCKAFFIRIQKANSIFTSMANHFPETSPFFTDATLAKIQSQENTELSELQYLIKVLFSRKSTIITFVLSVVVGIVFGFYINKTMFSETTISELSEETETIEDLYWAGISSSDISEFFLIQEDK